MAKNSGPITASSTAGQWNLDLVLFTVSDPLRRRMLLSVARNGPMTGENLHHTCGGREISGSLKHLAVMCKSGFIIKQGNPNDKRKPLYALAPAVPLKQTETGVFLDFGFFNLRLDAR